MFNSNTNQHTQAKKNINKQIFLFIKKKDFFKNAKVIQPGLRYTLHDNNLFVLGYMLNHFCSIFITSVAQKVLMYGRGCSHANPLCHCAFRL